MGRRRRCGAMNLKQNPLKAQARVPIEGTITSGAENEELACISDSLSRTSMPGRKPRKWTAVGAADRWNMPRRRQLSQMPSTTSSSHTAELARPKPGEISANELCSGTLTAADNTAIRANVHRCLASRISAIRVAEHVRNPASYQKCARCSRPSRPLADFNRVGAAGCTRQSGANSCYLAVRTVTRNRSTVESDDVDASATLIHHRLTCPGVPASTSCRLQSHARRRNTLPNGIDISALPSSSRIRM